MTEKDIEKLIILSAQKAGSTLFKNNVGTCEKIDPRTGQKYFIRFGLCEGSSDLIGITPIEIKPYMVGKRIGVFTAIEVKKDIKKSYNKHRMETQNAFIDFVNTNGGIAFKADDPEKVLDFINRLK